MWMCYLEFSILHTWVLSTLCKAYLEHTLPGAARRLMCKVKLQLSISKGQHRLQAWAYRADQPSWRTKASVSRGSSGQHTHTNTHLNWEGREGHWAQQDLFTTPDWAKTNSKHPPTAHKYTDTHTEDENKGRVNFRCFFFICLFNLFCLKIYKYCTQIRVRVCFMLVLRNMTLNPHKMSVFHWSSEKNV